MKTSLLAALSNNQRYEYPFMIDLYFVTKMHPFFFSQIIAIERDVKRCKTLRQTIEKTKAWKVTVECGDFLNLDPSSYEDVKYILVDPSCSGSGNITIFYFIIFSHDYYYESFSGIVNRFEPLDKKNDNLDFQKSRLEKLASIQCRLLEHAAKFPQVQRIVLLLDLLHPVCLVL